jgi:hypothetical protein
MSYLSIRIYINITYKKNGLIFDESLATTSNRINLNYAVGAFPVNVDFWKVLDWHNSSSCYILFGAVFEFGHWKINSVIFFYCLTCTLVDKPAVNLLHFSIFFSRHSVHKSFPEPAIFDESIDLYFLYDFKGLNVQNDDSRNSEDDYNVLGECFHFGAILICLLQDLGRLNKGTIWKLEELEESTINIGKLIPNYYSFVEGRTTSVRLLIYKLKVRRVIIGLWFHLLEGL